MTIKIEIRVRILVQFGRPLPYYSLYTVLHYKEKALQYPEMTKTAFIDISVATRYTI